jgi:NitT/TauT family transport system ATP-binding protein
MSVYVAVRGARKVYPSPRGNIEALHAIDLTIQSGEFLSVVGPSGCGKSTLLKCIAGLEQISSGSIQICGEDVFQRDVLLDWRTVINNVLLPVEFRNGNRKEKQGRAMDLLRLFHLQGFETRYPWELSGGMRQRVAICRALLDDPALLLMDEPFGALDALTRDELNIELQTIWEQTKKTVLFITHSISEAVLLSDRVAVMRKMPGEIVDIVEIHLPRPRTLAMRETPEFGHLMRHIRMIFESLGVLRRTQ